MPGLTVMKSRLPIQATLSPPSPSPFKHHAKLKQNRIFLSQSLPSKETDTGGSKKRQLSVCFSYFVGYAFYATTVSGYTNCSLFDTFTTTLHSDSPVWEPG